MYGWVGGWVSEWARKFTHGNIHPTLCAAKYIYSLAGDASVVDTAIALGERCHHLYRVDDALSVDGQKQDLARVAPARSPAHTLRSKLLIPARKKSEVNARVSISIHLRI